MDDAEKQDSDADDLLPLHLVVDRLGFHLRGAPLEHSLPPSQISLSILIVVCCCVLRSWNSLDNHDMPRTISDNLLFSLRIRKLTEEKEEKQNQNIHIVNFVCLGDTF